MSARKVTMLHPFSLTTCNYSIRGLPSDNGLLPDWRQAVIWTNAGILLTGPIETNYSEILL